ncbi:uncharacterized protein BDR25DRAFT_363565 [Lindgomyces ingoldianus]|uniref:Uncharacterized protein n=1 Tax=Lindgomyces ingoldianus TaxID=673940 RepID=A0ACB6Q795_9PLEO|nr:uncharacterized protein BDR25DRAFT_363565 [Lindgomyces ingoldianus]KAF2462723.1 hypothetical protein BDR25DRAFT_363565 [Lindgomyces ingoldianus]
MAGWGNWRSSNSFEDRPTASSKPPIVSALSESFFKPRLAFDRRVRLKQIFRRRVKDPRHWNIYLLTVRHKKVHRANVRFTRDILMRDVLRITTDEIFVCDPLSIDMSLVSGLAVIIATEPTSEEPFTLPHATKDEKGLNFNWVICVKGI